MKINLDSVLALVGLARRSRLNATERELQKHQTIVTEMLEESTALIVAEDGALLSNIWIEDGRKVVVSPGARHVHISNLSITGQSKLRLKRNDRK